MPGKIIFKYFIYKCFSYFHFIVVLYFECGQVVTTFSSANVVQSAIFFNQIRIYSYKLNVMSVYQHKIPCLKFERNNVNIKGKQ